MGNWTKEEIDRVMKDFTKIALLQYYLNRDKFTRKYKK